MFSPLWPPYHWPWRGSVIGTWGGTWGRLPGMGCWTGWSCPWSPPEEEAGGTDGGETWTGRNRWVRMMGKERSRRRMGGEGAMRSGRGRRRRRRRLWDSRRKGDISVSEKQRDWTTKRSLNVDKEATIFITTAEGKAVPTSTAAQERWPQHRSVTQGNKPQSRPFNIQHARPFTKPHLELKRN